MRAIPLLLIAAFLVVAAGFATAQAAELPARVSLSIEGDAEPIPPSNGPAWYDLRVTYERASPTGLHDARVRLEVVDAPSWAHVDLTQAETRIPTGPANGPRDHFVAQARATIAVDDLAQAFAPGDVCIRAVVGSDGVHEGGDFTDCVTVTPDFWGRIDVQPDQTRLRVPPGDARTLLVHVQNLGNAPTKVFFDVQHAPPGVHVAPPAPRTLDSPGEDGSPRTAADFPVEIGLDGRTAGGTVHITIRSNYAFDAAIKGQTQPIRIDVEPHEQRTFRFAPSAGEGDGDGTGGGWATPGILSLLGAAAGFWIRHVRTGE